MQKNIEDFKLDQLVSDKDLREKLEVILEKIEAGAVYEEGIFSDKSQTYDLITIKELLARSENLYGEVVKTIEDLLTDQGKAFELIKRADLNNLEGAIIAEAQELISDKGRLGPEAVSEKIVEYIKAVAEGDIKKIDALFQAIDEGFKETEKTLSNLIKAIEIVEAGEGTLKNESEIVERILRRQPENLKSLLDNKPEIARRILGNEVELSGSILKNEREIVQMMEKEPELAKILLESQGEPGKPSLTGEGETIQKSSGLAAQTGEEVLAKLPEVTQRSYEKIVDKLNEYIALEKLSKNPENIRVQLREMLEEIAVGQGETIKLIGELEGVRANEPRLVYLKGLLYLDGRYGIAHISNRMVNFVKIAAEDDPEKLASLIKTLEEVFREVEKGLKDLPDMSRKTFEMIMKKLEDWEEELKDLKKPTQIIIERVKKYIELLKNTKIFGIKSYKLLIAAWILVYYFYRLIFG